MVEGKGSLNLILVVEDTPESAYLLSALFAGHGYEVIVATDGAEGLKKARERPPDIVISDILMPVMDGFALCREWKADPILQSIPFVFYTATYTDPHNEAFALSLGADAFLIKPMEPEQLIEEIRNIFKKSHSHNLPFSEVISDDSTFYRMHNEALVHKLEQKLKETNDLYAKVSESEQKFRSLVTQAGDAFFVTDFQGRFLDVNPQACRYLGYTMEELLTLGISDIDESVSGQGDVKELISDLKPDSHLLIETTHRSKDGTMIPVEVRIGRIEMERKQRILLLVRDITERKLLEMEKLEAFMQIQKNLEQLAILNDQIRNPLTVMMTLLENMGFSDSDLIMKQVYEIEKIVSQLDSHWEQEEKVRRFLCRHYGYISDDDTAGDEGV